MEKTIKTRTIKTKSVKAKIGKKSTERKPVPKKSIEKKALKKKPSNSKAMTKAQIQTFFERLREQRPNPETELNYGSTFQLLIAVLLSAQATDVSVNKATDQLFQDAPDAHSMYALGVEKLKNYIKTIGLFNSKAENVIIGDSHAAHYLGATRELENFDIDIEEHELSIYTRLNIEVPIPEHLYRGLTAGTPEWTTGNRADISKSPALQLSLIHI